MRIARERKRILRLLEEVEDVFHVSPRAPVVGSSSTYCVGRGCAAAAALRLRADLRRHFASHLLHGRRLLLARRVRVLDQLDVQAQRLQLLEEHVERLRQAGLERVLALDDRLVHARAADDVVGLDGQELLQTVGGAVGLHRPHFHLAETLAAELRLAAQRLLGDQRVRPDRARVDLVVDQVVQLQHVHDADGDVVVERLAGLAVEQRRLTVGGQARHASARS